MRTDHTLVIYNQVTDKDDRVTFYRSEMPCHWEETTGKVLSAGSTGGPGIRSAEFFVPRSQKPKGKLFVDEKVYKTLNDHQHYFTFASEDIVWPYMVKGAEILDRNSMKELKRRNPDFFIVQTSSNQDFGSPALRHWDVTCSQ